ncbi:ccr4-not complex not1 [Cyclospora cayetanensis]|uniref:Ccr4-not complex not1 n=1 Tax=Cyclospora cayetanensis TaxID=88456 RepID=A0A1D3CXB4_9EIME|nr:ccr4-not complex not1 [Cyclospora cayetanensis]
MYKALGGSLKKAAFGASAFIAAVHAANGSPVAGIDLIGCINTSKREQETAIARAVAIYCPLCLRISNRTPQSLEAPQSATLLIPPLLEVYLHPKQRDPQHRQPARCCSSSLRRRWVAPQQLRLKGRLHQRHLQQREMQPLERIWMWRRMYIASSRGYSPGSSSSLFSLRTPSLTPPPLSGRFGGWGASAELVLAVLERGASSSASPRDSALVALFLSSLFRETRHLPKYPLRELAATAVLLGQLLRRGLLLQRGPSLSVAQRCITEAIKKGIPSKMWLFGVAALEQVLECLPAYPLFAAAIAERHELLLLHSHYTEFAARVVAALPPELRGHVHLEEHQLAGIEFPSTPTIGMRGKQSFLAPS